jgi:glutamyl-tRNA synthetase
VQDRLKTLADLAMMTSYFFSDPTPDWQMVADNKQLKNLEKAATKTLLEQARDTLAASEFDADSLQETLNRLLEITGHKPGVVFSLVRLAVSWAPFSPALSETLAALGKETVLCRLNTAIASI